MTRIKVCGVTSAADRDAVVAAGVDAVGVIVDVPVDTPRAVAADRAAALLEGLPPFVSGVLVTMQSAVQPVVDLQERVGADAVQVHDGLDPDGLEALGQRVDADVVAVVDGQAPAVRAYADAADALLVDSVDAEGGGGTGRTHDWDRTRDIVADLGVPVVLAGGLTPENVGEAVRTVEPYAVDTASGVESAGGQKDHDAVAAFVRHASRQEVSA
ncbi:phosphoribosylanthranilate isomerase [Halobacteriales archaeon Cl-PHB]